MSRYERVDVHRPPPPESSEDGSDSEFESGSAPRTSTDIRRHDQEILEGEEEVEKLLTGGNEPSGLKKLFRREDSTGNEVKMGDKQRQQFQREIRREEKREKRRGKRDDRREKRRQRRGNKEEESELMYEMEEGHKDSTDSSGNSSEVDKANLGDFTAPRTPRMFRLGKVAGVYTVILLVFAALLYGAYRASSHKPHAKHILQTLSNGTSTFAPTTIYISLDGFRADFLHRNITPFLNAFVQDGISPKWMVPSFPSVTFPNHFTLVTGLYPEAHGVVGNTFWDPTLKEEFYYTDPARSMQPKWWLGEPIWATAESQGLRAAIHMWPGSEAHIGEIEPTYVDKYNGKELLSNKVNRILGLLDLPGHDDIGANADTPRPQLIAAYVPNVDQHGHLYGPNSTEIRADISSVDTMLGDLFQGLLVRNLTDIVNIVIVSDHGMATTDISRLIQLDDLIDMNLIEHTDGWPLYGLRPSNEADLEPLYNHLKQEASANGNYEVYLRDRDMPERYHFSKNERIAPLWIIPKTGWAIVTKEEFDVEKGRKEGLIYHPRGLHGYDHEHPLMRAIFIARGPAFPHTPGSKMEVFQNIEVYNIVCDSLGINPKPNNGTLRLPLKPVGLHSEDLPEETPNDPELPEHSVTSEPAKQSVSFEIPTNTESFATPDTSKAPDTLETSETLDIPDTLTASDVPEPTEPPADTRPVVQDGGDPEDEQFNYWWDWVKGKLDGAKDWATGLVDKVNTKINDKTDDQ